MSNRVLGDLTKPSVRAASSAAIRPPCPLLCHVIETLAVLRRMLEVTFSAARREASCIHRVTSIFGHQNHLTTLRGLGTDFNVRYIVIRR